MAVRRHRQRRRSEPVMPACWSACWPAGYESAAKVAKLALAEGITLAAAAERLGLLTPEEFKALVVPQHMIEPRSPRDTNTVR